MAKIVRTHVYAHVHACARIKRSVTGPLRGPGTNPEGVGIRAGKPKADRAIRKEKLPLTNPEGVGTGPRRGWYRTPKGPV